MVDNMGALWRGGRKKDDASLGASPFRLPTKVGVDHSLVHYWVKKNHAGELSLDLLREEASVEDAQHIAALERKVGQLTMELDLLKSGLIASPAGHADGTANQAGGKLSTYQSSESD